MVTDAECHRSQRRDAAGQLRVAIAEDNLLVREGLVGLLGGADGIDVAAAVESVDELLAVVADDAPDVVLTDIQLGGDRSDEGILAATHLRQSNPDLGVVVLSAFVEPSYAVDLLDAGTNGRGYVVKDHVADIDYLVLALRTVAAGGSFLDDTVVEALVRSRSRASDQQLAALSSRELEVLAEIATGRSNAAVAAQLSVSEHAIEKHTNVIFSKLGLAKDPDVNRRVTAVLLYLTGQHASADPADPVGDAA